MGMNKSLGRRASCGKPNPHMLPHSNIYHRNIDILLPDERRNKIIKFNSSRMTIKAKGFCYLVYIFDLNSPFHKSFILQ